MTTKKQKKYTDTYIFLSIQRKTSLNFDSLCTPKSSHIVYFQDIYIQYLKTTGNYVCYL